MTRQLRALEESVQKLEIKRIDRRAEDRITLPERRHALLANFLFRDAPMRP